MHVFKRNQRICGVILAALLFAGIAPNRLMADDKETSNPPAKSLPLKSDSTPPGLSERGCPANILPSDGSTIIGRLMCPYFSGSGGVTPPGGNQGSAGSVVCLNGFTICNGSPANTWLPDLRKSENRLNMAILVKF